jgi:hypothetical protein
MHGYAIAAFTLLIFGGVLRPPESRARAFVSYLLEERVAIRRFRQGHAGVEPRRDAPPAPAAAPPMSLNPIELALIAEYSLEMARANEAVAEDATVQLETRRRASEVATAWRRRAQLFQMQARCQSAQPIIPGEQSIHVPGRAYTGPERRQKMRRTQTRRTEWPLASPGRSGHDRRAQVERRRRDRRRPEPAPR